MCTNLSRTDRNSSCPFDGKALPLREVTGDLNMHGRGAGDDGPIITAHAKSARQLAVTLQENMVFIYKPCAISADGTSICTWGDSIVITANGGRRLGKRPHDLAVSGG
jgi:Xaa-Pro aminopeptidase